MKTTTLGDIGSLSNGANFNKNDYGDGYPIVNVKQLYATRFVALEDTLQVRKSAISNAQRLFLNAGDLLFARSSVKASGAGQVAMIETTPDESSIFSGFIIRFRPDNIEVSDPLYLNYVLRSPKYRSLFTKIVTGTTISNLSQSILSSIELSLPEIEKQKAIAQILGTLDDKIELNRQTNKTLESIARTIFKSWFVDFDPVRAKRDGINKEGDKATPYSLSPDILELFPDSFQDSELGEIPMGWEVGSILDQADLISGGTPKTNNPDFWGGDIPWASAKDVSQCGETFLIKPEKFITQAGLDGSSTKLVDKYSTVIVARGATTGRLVMFGSEMAMNQTCYALRSKYQSPCYINCLSLITTDRLLNSAHGSVFDTITTKTFETTNVLSVPKELTREFDRHASPIYRKILLNQQESITLSSLRDTLLPKLISGELQIKDAEKFVSEIT